jgi:hypothetical protein
VENSGYSRKEKSPAPVKALDFLIILAATGEIQ